MFRTLDEDGDMTFGKGLNNYSTNDEEIKLDIQTSINSWLGDCFFATNKGIDWWNRLGSKNQQQLLEQDIKTTILNVTGVTEVLDISVNVIDRKFKAEYTITTIFSKSFTNLVERSI